MSTEIERKFLVLDDTWRTGAQPVLCRQGYLAGSPGLAVRVRVLGELGTLTIKGPTEGLSRAEYEYPIPLVDAAELLDRFCRESLVEKYRSVVVFDGRRWEVDEFLGANAGLLLAEVELQSEHQEILLPPWVGREVSREERYRNAALASHPYARWSRKEKRT